MSKRNGKIELLRFVFCISILLYHINNDLWDGDKVFNGHISFFSHGRTGVEFFFLVTGYLTAKSVYKIYDKKKSIGKSTFDFMVKKINTVLIPHFIVVGLMIAYLIYAGKLDFHKFMNRLPSVFFLQALGISSEFFLGVEWYLASMFFALAIIYPLLLKNFDFTSKVIAPVGSVLLVGYLISKYKCLHASNVPDPYISPANLRALAVILMGVFCFTVSERLKEINFSARQKALLIITENICWAISLLFLVSTLSKKYEGIILIIMAVAVTLTFTRNFNSIIYNNSLVSYLGRISLTVYLCQNVTRKIIREQLDMSNKVILIITVISTVLLGMLLDFLCNRKKATVKSK